MHISKRTFGARLKKCLKPMGWKQNDLAKAMNMELATIRNWVQGRTWPEMETFLDLCRIFGCDTDYLFGNIDERTHDLDFVCKYTGLSAHSIEVLRNIPRWDITGVEANNDLDYFISNYGEDLAFHLSEIRDRRTCAAIETGKIGENIGSSERFQISMEVSRQIRNTELSLFSFSEFCREIPENLYGTSKLLRKLRALYEQLHKYREQEGKDDGQ